MKTLTPLLIANLLWDNRELQKVEAFFTEFFNGNIEEYNNPEDIKDDIENMINGDIDMSLAYEHGLKMIISQGVAEITYYPEHLEEDIQTMDEIMEMDDEDVAEELGMDRIGDAVDYATGYPYRVVQLVKLYHELSTND